MNGLNVFEKTIGIWLSEKKSQKLNWSELTNVCRSHGYNVLKLDIFRPLEDQGHIDIFLHKLTDIIAAADHGDCQASLILSKVEQYLSNHPNVIVIDPLDNVRILLNRYRYYSILQNEPSFKKQGIFTPHFAEFTTNNIDQNIEIMRQRGVRFPVICKPSKAHEMIVIFNERGLSVCKPPCVVQNFVNHNAVLHKVYVVGNRYHLSKRPSLKNFYASEDMAPIYYSTGEVCKADSQSTLSILDPQDKADIRMDLNEDKIRNIIKVLRKEINLTLAGFDVVIDNATGHHAVIDINVFPSYDNFPDFFEHFLECINEIVGRSRNNCNSNVNGVNDYSYSFNELINVSTCPSKYGVIGMNVN